MGLRLWANTDTGEIIGWAGDNRYEGIRTYLFVVEGAQLEGATVRHHRGGHASLRLANGTSLAEVLPQSRAQPGSLSRPRDLPAGTRWVTCDDAGVPVANALA
jgi:hypothetical protein